MKFKRVSVCFPVCTSLRSKGKIQDFRTTKEAPIDQSREDRKKSLHAGEREEYWIIGSMSWDY